VGQGLLRDAGFLKIDLLGLGMLSAVERCVEEVGRARGERLDLSRIPLDDAETFESIRAAETTGVFQIESRAQMQMLPRTCPRTSTTSPCRWRWSARARSRAAPSTHI
jgi:error-prone DNA polymerase